MINQTPARTDNKKKDVVKTFSALRPGLPPNHYIDQLNQLGYAVKGIKQLPSRVMVDIEDQTMPEDRFLVTLWQIPKWQGDQVTDISIYPAPMAPGKKYRQTGIR